MSASPLLLWPPQRKTKFSIVGLIPGSFQYEPLSCRPDKDVLSISRTDGLQDSYLEQSFLLATVYFALLSSDTRNEINGTSPNFSGPQSSVELSQGQHTPEPVLSANSNNSSVREQMDFVELESLSFLGDSALSYMKQLIDNRQIDANTSAITALDHLCSGALGARLSVFPHRYEGCDFRLSIFNTEKGLVRSMFILETMVWAPVSRFEVRLHAVEPQYLAAARETQMRFVDRREACTSGVHQYYNGLLAFCATLAEKHPVEFPHYPDPGIAME